MLNAFSGNIWQCNKNRGGYCQAPVWCETFNGDEYSSWNYTDYDFKVNFTTNQTFYTRLPLMSFMRNGDNSSQPTCNLMIYRTMA